MEGMEGEWKRWRDGWMGGEREGDRKTLRKEVKKTQKTYFYINAS